MMEALGKRSLSALLLWVIAVIFVQFYPSKSGEEEGLLAIVLLVGVVVLAITFILLKKEQGENRKTLANLSLLFAIIFLSWEATTGKWQMLDSFVFPSPSVVLESLSEDKVELWGHMWSSTKLILTGYGLALVAAVSLGLYAGWNKQLYELIKPLASVSSPIPPIVYIPYAITVLPSFFLSSVFVIFIGAFWPILMNTLNGVLHIEHRLIDSARTLQLSPYTMFRKVLLPGALPGIFTGASIGLVFGFILLTSAELIGASAGLGYYVKYYTDFGDFPRVIVGILVIGVYVTILMTILQKLEKYFLRWKQR